MSKSNVSIGKIFKTSPLDDSVATVINDCVSDKTTTWSSTNGASAPLTVNSKGQLAIVTAGAEVPLDVTDEKTNTPEQHRKQKEFLISGNKTLPSDGFILWVGTKYSNNDPISTTLKNTLQNKKDKFTSFVKSCYINDDPEKSSTFIFEKKWTNKKETSYTVDMLRTLSQDNLDRY